MAAESTPDVGKPEDMGGFSARHIRSIVAAVPAVSRRHGVVRTLRLAASELLFDLHHGTDTTLHINSSGSSIATEFHGGHANVEASRHEACNPVIFSEMVRCLPISPADATMLDFGSGKGRALMMAVERGFRKVVGVEVSEQLFAVADHNIARFRRRHPTVRIELACEDAATFEVPDDVNVAFLFNPFGADVVASIVGQIGNSVRRVPREFYILYVHPLFADQFLKAGFSVERRHGTVGMILARVTQTGDDRAATADPP
jgi:SAM-dependent methyltransferase